MSCGDVKLDSQLLQWDASNGPEALAEGRVVQNEAPPKGARCDPRSFRYVTMAYLVPHIFDLGLDLLEVKGGWGLLWGKLDKGLGQLLHLLLHEHEAPEFVDIEVPKGCRHLPEASRPLERICPKVYQLRKVRRDLGAEPTSGLVEEDVLVGADPSRAKVGLGEIPDLLARRFALPN